MRNIFRLLSNGIVALLSCTLLLLATSCTSNGKKLHIYCWADTISPSLIEKFEAEYGCQIVIDTYDTNESMYAKLKAGAQGYDIIVPSSYQLDLLAQQKMIHELDLTKIPNVKYIDLSLLPQDGVPPLKEGIPFHVAFSSIGYRKDRVENPQPTWAMFSREDLRGRMTMLNDPREIIGAALKFLGYSANSRSAKEIYEATQTIIGWKRNLSKFESEQYSSGLASAEFLLSYGYNGDLLRIMNENPDVAILYAKEGTLIGVDHLTIPQGAPNIDLAHNFINFMLQPENAAINIQHVFFYSPNIAAYELLPPKLKNNPGLIPSADILRQSEVIKDLGADSRLYYSAWDVIKAAP